MWIEPLDSVRKKKSYFIPKFIWSDSKFLEIANMKIGNFNKSTKENFDGLLKEILVTAETTTRINMNLLRRNNLNFDSYLNNMEGKKKRVNCISYLEAADGFDTSNIDKMKEIACEHFKKHFSVFSKKKDFHFTNMTKISEQDI